MATAVCTTCGAETSWSARRGSTLAEVRCATCGGALRGKTAGAASPRKGQRAHTCAACGRRGFRMTVVASPRRLAHPGLVKRAGQPVDPNEIYPTGSVLCAVHTTESVDPAERFEALRRSCGEQINQETGYGHRRLPVFFPETRCIAQPPPEWTEAEFRASWTTPTKHDAVRFGFCEQGVCPLLAKQEAARAHNYP